MPVFWTGIYSLPLLLPLWKVDSKIVFGLISGMVVGKFFFGPLSNRVSIPWRGWVAIKSYLFDLYGEFLRDLWFTMLFKWFFVGLFFIFLIIPILNSPFPFIYGIKHDDKGLQWGAVLFISSVYLRRWGVCYITLKERRRIRDSNAHAFFMHYVTAPAFLVIILYVNIIYINAGFDLRNFSPHYFSYI